MGSPSGPTIPISLEPGSKLPESLQEREMNIPQSDRLFGTLAGEGIISRVLQGIKGQVTLPNGQKVDPEMFKSLVISTAVPTL